MPSDQSLFATVSRGMEPLLAAELTSMQAENVETGRSGVSFDGGMELAYRVCLWSRFANRVLLPLSRFPATTPEELYDGTLAIDWGQHLSPHGTLAVDCFSADSQIDHTHFASLKVKDAIVDQMRDEFGVRPSVELQRPHVRVNLYLYRNEARLAIDLAGESLHRRGYRREGGQAPLKETLAAAILTRAGWPEIAANGGGLVDPMCGSGTLCIEAAMIAADIAPGLKRPYFGFKGWKGFDATIWATLMDEARTRREAGIPKLPSITGYDRDPDAVRMTKQNAERAGLGGKVQATQGELADARKCGAGDTSGLFIANPPYGERLGEQQEIEPLYTRLGTTLKTHFGDWKAAVLTGNPKLAGALHLRPHRSYSLYNGPIKCRLLCFSIGSAAPAPPQTQKVETAPQAHPSAPAGSSTGIEMLANRLRKNLRITGRWARREGITCYRLYDADLPEYAFAVDVYQGDERWVHVQEYERPATVDSGAASRRRQEGLETIAAVLEVPASQVFFKMRRQQRGKAQYERQGATEKFFQVAEDGCQFWVNFADYLDTGLFLDQRLTRRMIQDRSAGVRFLNLFAYTGAATVRAAAGGAKSTTTVDMSTTYLDWAQRNMGLNDYTGASHELIRAECIEWVEEQGRGKGRDFDLIWLDPPTFSNSKRMDREFDVQRDHVDLIRKTVRLLAPGGTLLFSTNYRRFKLDEPGLAGLQLKDIAAATLPQDFERRKRMHNCWEITAA
jgi:23S rRNA (guanine2445-N2)-methyltransferase / 23S rRNA (guanine2069-N7)-methyltransferase